MSRNNPHRRVGARVVQRVVEHVQAEVLRAWKRCLEGVHGLKTPIHVYRHQRDGFQPKRLQPPGTAENVLNDFLKSADADLGAASLIPRVEYRDHPISVDWV